jgi:hypothetical protein
VRHGQLVALAVGVEDAQRQRAHGRAPLLAPPVRTDYREQLADLARHARVACTVALHELAHALVADTHALGGLRPR